MIISLPVIKKWSPLNDLYIFLCAGNSGCGMTRKIDFNKIIVSFWARKKRLEPLELICLGFFVRSSWIFLTSTCAQELEAYGDTIIKSASEDIQKTLSEETKIKNFEIIEAQSKFSIAYVSNTMYNNESFF